MKQAHWDPTDAHESHWDPTDTHETDTLGPN